MANTPDWSLIKDPNELQKAQTAYYSGTPVVINDVKYNVPGGPTPLSTPSVSSPQTTTPTMPTTPTTPTGTTGSEYYSRLPTGVTQEQVNTALTNQYAIKDPNAEYQKYVQDMIANQQARIDEINKRYADMLNRELENYNQNEGREMTQKANAISILTGNMGGSAAEARAAQANEYNRRQRDLITAKINDAKAQELAKVYDSIYQGAQKVYEAQMETNRENQKKLLEDIKNNALSNIQAMASTLAGTGKTFDDWKNADNGEALKSLMEQTGYTEYQIRQAWKNAIPEQYRPITTTTYHDDGKGGTIMQQVEFDPISKKVTVNSYPIAVPISTFVAPEKPIEGKNGELFVRQPDGTYIDVSPNANNIKFIEGTKYQPAGYFDAKTGKFTPLKEYGGNGSIGNGTGSDLSGKIIDPQLVVDKVSNSILSATGLSKLAFDYLTQGTPAFSRMGEATRKAVIKEAEEFANKNGVDVATFQSQYAGLSKTVSANVLRNNQAATAEAELDATLKNLREAVQEVGFGNVKISNIVKKWIKGELNDADVARYNFHLNQLVEEFAMYNAAIAGQLDANGNIRQLSESDLANARSIIQSGAAKGTIDGFENALRASMDKMKAVLKASIDAQNKQVWELFGVGNKYQSKNVNTNNSTKYPIQIKYNGKIYNVDENGDMTEA